MFIHFCDIVDNNYLYSFYFLSCTKEEAVALSKDLIRCLNFLYEDLRKCFTNLTNHSYLDHFLYVFFSRLLHDKNNKIATEQSRNNKDKVNEISLCDFSFLQPAAHTINLPLDAQIQIDAALSEMEAMDYRDWVCLSLQYFLMRTNWIFSKFSSDP